MATGALPAATLKLAIERSLGGPGDEGVRWGLFDHLGTHCKRPRRTLGRYSGSQSGMFLNLAALMH